MDPILGQIQLFPFTRDMDGWSKCVGQTVNIQQNQALYSLIGITYGGDAQSTFKLPDLRGAEPLPGMAYYIATNGLYPAWS
ncbi:MAG: phage tail protein [Cellulosilyticaceae bacterium]